MKNVNQEFDELMQGPTAYWVLNGDSRAHDLRQEIRNWGGYPVYAGKEFIGWKIDNPDWSCRNALTKAGLILQKA